MSFSAVAGLTHSTGKREKSFYCVIEDFPQEKRSFVKCVEKVSDERPALEREPLVLLPQFYQARSIVLDQPLVAPACFQCELQCPGERQCPKPEVRRVREVIEEIFEKEKEKGQKLEIKKDKEHLRGERSFSTGGEELSQKSDLELGFKKEVQISRSLRRKLKKGIMPFWHRPIDLWMWMNYHDLSHELQWNHYDSFGQTTQQGLYKLNYMKRHLDSGVTLYESRPRAFLMELLKAEMVTKTKLKTLKDVQRSSHIRYEVIQLLEKKLSLFIYQKDMELLVASPKAFQAFLLALAGLTQKRGFNLNLPDWTVPKKTMMAIPAFRKIESSWNKTDAK